MVWTNILDNTQVDVLDLVSLNWLFVLDKSQLQEKSFQESQTAELPFNFFIK